MSTTHKPVIDFDHHSAGYRENWVQIARDFHARDKAIAWSEAHGGFWVVANRDACVAMLEDWETYTSYNDLDGTGNGGFGQLVPQAPYRLVLGESDPPLHTGRRQLEAPFFTPRAVRTWGQAAQRHVDEAIDNVIESGRADLVNDVIIPTTARTTLYAIGYPGDWRDAALAAHTLSFSLPGDDLYPLEEMNRVRQEFRAILAERRKEDTGDLISALANGLVEGVPLTDDEGESMMNALVFGGFDSTTSVTAHALLWLSQNRHEIPRIRDDAAYRKNAVEEFLRFFPPTTHITRTAMRDTEILGQKISKGERVVAWFSGANRDPSTFENPDEIRLDRANAHDHMAFSAGVHRCLGSPLAKIEVSVMIETVLRRLPDFEVDIDASTHYPTFGFIYGMIDEPMTFAPGERLTLSV